MIGKAFDVSNWSGAFTAQLAAIAADAWKDDDEARQLARSSHLAVPRVRPLSVARPQALLGNQAGEAWPGEKLLTDAGAARCIKEELGYDLAIVGTQNRNVTRAQLAACEGVGLINHAYVYLYFSGDPVAQVNEALATCEGFGLGRLWLDCEDAFAENLTEAATVDFIRRAADACIGKVWSGIYTAGWWWERQTGNYQGFAREGFPLWHASADRRGDLGNVSYGGWDEIAMEQFQFDTLLCGVNTDLNVYRETVHPPVVTPDRPVDPPAPGGIALGHVDSILKHAEALRMELTK